MIGTELFFPDRQRAFIERLSFGMATLVIELECFLVQSQCFFKGLRKRTVRVGERFNNQHADRNCQRGKERKRNLLIGLLPSHSSFGRRDETNRPKQLKLTYFNPLKRAGPPRKPWLVALATLIVWTLRRLMPQI